jgi:hypothetical protein
MITFMSFLDKLTNLPHNIFGLGSGDEEICWAGVCYQNLSKQIDKVFLLIHHPVLEASLT